MTTKSPTVAEVAAAANVSTTAVTAAPTVKVYEDNKDPVGFFFIIFCIIMSILLILGGVGALATFGITMIPYNAIGIIAWVIVSSRIKGQNLVYN